MSSGQKKKKKKGQVSDRGLGGLVYFLLGIFGKAPL